MMKKSALVTMVGITALGFVGCSHRTPVATAQKKFYFYDADQAKADLAGQPYEDPSKVEGPMDPSNPPLSRLKKDYSTAQAAYKAKDTEQSKTELIKATMRLAEAYEFYPAKTNDPDLDRHEKYKKALQYYSEALILDPSNSEAQQNSQMIISIYKQMGKSVPK